MKFTVQGVVSISSGNTTVIAFMSENAQSFALPEGRAVDIAPILYEQGFILNGNSLQFAGKTVVLMVESRYFNRIEIMPFSEEDAASFFIALQSDADMNALIDKATAAYNERSDALIAGVTEICKYLPDDGPTASLVQKLESLNWTAATKEILIAFKTAQPKSWTKLYGLLNERGQIWVNNKIA